MKLRTLELLDLEHTMAGTGPYYFTEFKPDSSIKLAAFADYYMGEAAIKEVNYKVMTDASTILAALESELGAVLR